MLRSATMVSPVPRAASLARASLFPSPHQGRELARADPARHASLPEHQPDAGRGRQQANEQVDGRALAEGGRLAARRPGDHPGQPGPEVGPHLDQDARGGPARAQLEGDEDDRLVRKNLFDLRRAAAIQNLTAIQRKLA
jgi:hypothetical protein